MKKGVNLLFYSILIVFLFPYFVFAQEYELNTLIPVDTVATVHTEKFLYQDFVYGSAVDAKGYGFITFSAIQNNTISKIPISINLLLFDEKQKNIGLLSYCTNKDLDSDYNGLKLSGKQSSPFSIAVTPRYFVEGKSSKDVRFIAVMDENRYCQVGGNSNYAGLSLEEIIENRKKTPSSKAEILQKYFDMIQNSVWITYIVAIIVISIILSFLGSILNKLHRRMYGKTTTLASLPVTNAYIAAKMAFGSIVATVYFIICCISIALALVKIRFFLSVCVCVFIASFVVVLLKLVTKKYELFYFEPTVSYSSNNNTRSLNTVNKKNTEHFSDFGINNDESKDKFEDKNGKNRGVTEKKSFFSSVFGSKKDDDYVPPSEVNVSDSPTNMSLLDNDQPILNLNYENTSDSNNLFGVYSDNNVNSTSENFDGNKSSNLPLPDITNYEDSKSNNFPISDIINHDDTKSNVSSSDDLYDLSDDDDNDDFYDDDDGESDIAKFFH